MVLLVFSYSTVLLNYFGLYLFQIGFLLIFWYIVGVLEVNFLEPAHDKQDFEGSPLFIRLETRLKQMISEYWFVML